jgi:MoaE-MoaD fusion protein
MSFVTVKFFASCREQTGGESVSQVEIISGVTTTADLLTILLQKFPQLGNGIQEVKIAVNRSYIETPQVLKEGDEIALLPPISGG